VVEFSKLPYRFCPSMPRASEGQALIVLASAVFAANLAAARCWQHQLPAGTSAAIAKAANAELWSGVAKITRRVAELG
jgi:hypothetical protein